MSIRRVEASPATGRPITSITGVETHRVVGVALLLSIGACLLSFGITAIAIAFQYLGITRIAGIDLVKVYDLRTEQAAPLLTAGLLFVLVPAAIAAVDVAWLSWRAGPRLRARGVMSRADVTEVVQSRDEGGAPSNWVVVYRYPAGGAWQWGRRALGYEPPRLRPGDSFEVVYDPAHPKVHGLEYLAPHR